MSTKNIPIDERAVLVEVTGTMANIETIIEAMLENSGMDILLECQTETLTPPVYADSSAICRETIYLTPSL